MSNFAKTGIAVCLLIFVIIRFETSFDGFHAKKDRIYRVLTEYHHPGADVFYGASAPAPLPSVIKTGFPDLKISSGIATFPNVQITIPQDKGQPGKLFREKKGIFAVQPEFFDIFDFAWVAGSPITSLKDPNSAVLTKEMAVKYFGDWKSALGKTIVLDKNLLLKVTGILASIPANTDFQFKIVIPYGRQLGYYAEAPWWNNNDTHDCYLLLPPGETQATFNRKLRAFGKKFLPAEMKDEWLYFNL